MQEHINGFQKGVRQASFFYENVDVNDVRFDVNKDVVDGVLIDEAESSPEEDGGRRQSTPMLVVTRWWQRTSRRRQIRIFNLIFPIWFNDSKSVITRTLLYFDVCYECQLLVI